MGLMEQPPVDARQVVFTPHPVTLEGQQHLAAEMLPGEKLGAFLARTIPDYGGDVWEVRINGVVVPHQVLDRVRPKENTLVEVRGVVHRQALMIVALIALTVFTAGVGTAMAAAGYGAITTALVTGAITIAGTLLINKVLGPKPPKPAEQADPVQSITSARNTPRPYQPPPMLLGSIRITPDILSMPYTWYEGRQQYLGMVLCAGINVHSIEELRNGETLLSSYQGVQVYKAGFTGEAEQDIPLYSNADTIAGGELVKEGTWVERTTGLDTVRIQINLEYLLGDADSKGRPKNNTDTVQAEYRQTGSGTWLPLISRTFTNNNFDPQRATLSADVAAGQYDVRVRRLGTAIEHTNGKAQFQFTTLTAVQLDPADYAGLARIGIRIQASGQLNGALDEVRGIAHSTPCPVWNGTTWVEETTSNPGAQLLQYARGFRDENGRLIAGMGLPDEMIDIPSLQAFMLHCAAEGYTYDHYLTDPRSHNEVCNVIALAGFGQVTWAGGRFGVVWVAQDQPLSGVVNMATIKRGTFQVDYTLANAADGIEYTYIDTEAWQPTTLRVTAPGVTTMLNPAQVTGEGITGEEHAARMARWHLAQHLYQYKDVGYGTDLEYLSYRRLSVLALQHDLTQWGYGGRLRGASVVGGVVSIALDEPVPPPASGNAYVGLRIPGETVYRVFQVEPFTGESDTLTLVEAWPGEAAFPGDDAGNPAHDTIWCYDFKQTPGLRCRVVAIEPEGDMEGARVSVVPEPPEFWTYVLTGEYTPPANQSLLVTRPVASNLTVTEHRVVQGDTVFTELALDFDVTGPMAYATVHAAQNLDGVWGDFRQMAETRTTEARFRIPSAGAYRIVVRPHNADGIVGVPVSVDYVTEEADIPPPPFDSVEVENAGAGIRRYTWAYNSTTLQAPDFAGAEVRYLAGTHATPDWEAMTPVGNADGFHTAAFENVMPPGGTWTFAFRARNTSGELSAATVITRTLPDALPTRIDDITAAQVAQQAEIDAATAASLTAALEAAKALALAGTPWDADTTWAEGDVVYHEGRMYRARDTSTGVEPPNATYWQDVGTVTEAQGETFTALQQLRVDVDDQGDEFASAITALNSDKADVTAVTALTTRVQTVEQAGYGANLLPNSAMQGGNTRLWDYYALDGNWNAPVVNLAGGDWTPPGMWSWGVQNPNTGVPGSNAINLITPRTTVSAGQRYIASIYAAAHRGVAQAFIEWRNAAGGIISYSSGTTLDAGASNTGGNDISLYTRLVVSAVAPTGARFASIVGQARGNGNNNPYAWFLRPMIEWARDEQVEPSPWNAGGLEASAEYTVTTDVNGNIAGIRLANNGTTSEFAILANVFRVLTNGAASGMEWQANYIRIYGSGYQLVMGTGFGASNNLVQWFGANIGAAACTTANCVECKTTAGVTILRGSTAAGSTEITPTQINIRDASNVLRVQMGLW